MSQACVVSQITIQGVFVVSIFVVIMLLALLGRYVAMVGSTPVLKV